MKFTLTWPTAAKTAWFIILTFSYICVWIIATNWLFMQFGWHSTDDSDADGRHPSGMGVHVDHATGVNYLSTWSGSIVVRITTNGTPYITKP